MMFFEMVGGYLKKYPRLLDFLIIVFSLSVFTFGVSLVFDTGFNWVNWKYDDAEHLSIAYNLYNGKGFTRDFIDLGADTKSTNIPHLSDYDQISNHLRNKFPFYFILMGGWLAIFQADNSNWNFYGILFNSLVSAMCIIAFYFWVKKYFSPGLAMFSAPLLAIMPGLIWFAVRIRPDVLAFLFIILTIYFGLKEITYRNAVLVGILAALSHFSHTIGLLPGIAIVIYFLIKRKFVASLILIGTWILILIPWLARNYAVFGDALQGTGIPVPREILIKIGLVSPDARNLNVHEIGTIAGTSVTQTIDGMIDQFSTIYGMEYFLILICFSFFAFVSFSVLKNALNRRKGKILLVTGIILYSLCINYVFLAKSDNSDIDLQIAILFIIPFAIFLYVKLFSEYRELFSSHRKNVYLLVAIFVLLSFVPYFMYAQVTGRIVPEVRIIIHSLYLLLPLSLIGIFKLVNVSSSFLWAKSQRYITMIVAPLIIIVFSVMIFSTGVNDIIHFHQGFGEKEFQIDMHRWMTNNIPKDANIASDLPHAVLLKTGNKAVNFAHAFKDNVDYENWIIKKFDVDYLVFYYYKDLVPKKGLEKLDLGDLNLQKVFDGEKGGLIYKVNIENQSN
jgi:hypothetical protein